MRERNTMSSCQVITCYETLSALTGKMRDTAVQGEWDKLVGIGQQCSQQIALIEPMDARATLDEPAQRHKIQIIKKILADDTEIRNLTEARMGQMRHILKNNRQEQQLQQAYSIFN